MRCIQESCGTVDAAAARRAADVQDAVVFAGNESKIATRSFERSAAKVEAECLAAAQGRPKRIGLDWEDVSTTRGALHQSIS
jgi:hypothetical protein